MDCDVYGPSIPLLMGSNEKPQLLGENLLAPNESFGIKLMSMGLLIDEDSPVVWRGSYGNENYTAIRCQC